MKEAGVLFSIIRLYCSVVCLHEAIAVKRAEVTTSSPLLFQLQVRPPVLGSLYLEVRTRQVQTSKSASPKFAYLVLRNSVETWKSSTSNWDAHCPTNPNLSHTLGISVWFCCHMPQIGQEMKLICGVLASGCFGYAPSVFMEYLAGRRSWRWGLHTGAITSSSNLTPNFPLMDCDK